MILCVGLGFHLCGWLSHRWSQSCFPGGDRWFKQTRRALSKTNSAFSKLDSQWRSVRTEIRDLLTIRNVATERGVSVPAKSSLLLSFEQTVFQTAWTTPMGNLSDWRSYDQWANETRDVIQRLHRMDSESVPMDKLESCGLVGQKHKKKEVPVSPSSTGTLLHIRRGKKTSGPFPPKRIRELIVEGKLKPNDLLRLDGDDSWTAASEIPNLARAFKAQTE